MTHKNANIGNTPETYESIYVGSTAPMQKQIVTRAYHLISKSCTSASAPYIRLRAELFV